MSEKSYRTAQLSTLAAFLPWGSLKGAGRMTLTPDKCKAIISIQMPQARLYPYGPYSIWVAGVYQRSKLQALSVSGE